MPPIQLIEQDDLICLRPFAPLDHVKLDRVAFLQALVPLGLDRTVVDEDIGGFRRRGPEKP